MPRYPKEQMHRITYTKLMPEQITGRLAAAVVYENAIGPECPAVEMARQQGGGVVTRTEHVIVENAYVRHDGVWRFQHSTLRQV